ncbi:MAG TPA: cell division protein FtsQ/DivIB [Solirubrobacteraceae bacterium]|jgi:cell division protein FtsQ|nr:cell division protein FtsQ/DivIB [Solirubrobacteraceae bacterium]
MIGGGRGQGVLRRRGMPALGRRRAAASRPTRRRRLPRPGPRFLAGVAVLVAVLVGGWFWLRSSSLVAVRRVTIAGVSGPDVTQIRLALRSAARDMTTLNVKMSAFHTAVAPYPVVKQVHVSTDFPHGVRIDVVEQVPVAMISAGGRQTAVSSDGTLLHDTGATIPLPTIAVTVAPGGTRVTGAALAEARLLAAAPYALLAKVAQASTDPDHGLVAQLRNGPRLYFGAAAELSAKWAAAAAVLADPSSNGAQYVDVTDPARPAAGPGSDIASSGSDSAGAAASDAGASSAATSANPDATAASSGG